MNHNLKMLSNAPLGRQFSLSVCRNQKKNHYDCLGITPKATQGDIKSAYYKLSKEYHPDTNSGNESAAEKFRDIAEAYEVLGNLKARKLYDRGIITKGGFRDDSQSNEPVNDNFKHASFYHQRNKPLTTKTALSGKTRYYDMDEWTRGHYSETFSKVNAKKEESRVYMEEKVKTKKENIYFSQLVGLIVLFMGCGLVYGTDASRNFDVITTEQPIPEEKPD